MNKRLKVLSSLLTAAIVATSLVGCGSKTTTTSGDSGKEGKKIIVWSHLMDAEVKEVDKAAQEWAKKTGNTVKVVADKSEMQAFLQAAKSTKGPDMMFGIPQDNLGTFKKANLLTEVPSDIIDKSKYVPVTLEAVSYDQKLYGVPLSMESIALFHRKDKAPKAPETIDELIEMGKKVGFKYPVNDFYYAFPFLAANGGYVFKDNNGSLDPNDIGLGNEGAKKGFQTIQEFVTKHKFMSADIKGDMAKGEFQNGKAAIYIGGPWDVDSFKKANVDFEVSTLPKVDGKTMPTFVGVQTAFVNAKSKNQKETWDLMKYLTENTSMPLLKTGNRIPALKAELDKPEVKENAILNAFATQAQSGISMPNIPAMTTVWKPGEDNLRLLTSGKQTPDQAAKNIVDQIKQGVATQK